MRMTRYQRLAAIVGDAVAVLAGCGVTAAAALGLFGSLSNYFTERSASGCYPQPKLASSLSPDADLLHTNPPRQVAASPCAW